ncbi:hypothetical protein FRB95_003219 [Tulasnella sp. JGI-2019a]|nr:hypothetical protein FRB95_003219 [Tulasnella sp. JGI-2019a]
MAKGKRGKPNKTPHGNGSVKNLHLGSVALKIPEILKEVLLLSERPERATSARVCRAWSSIAIDVLWHHLDSIFPLLELIAPLERGSVKRLVFSDLVEPVDWERFDSYERRVRSLAYNDTGDRLTRNGYTGIISKAIFSDVYINNPESGPLLPNVSKVTWITGEVNTALLLLPFLSSSTLSLRIELEPKCPVKTINSLLNRLGGRVSGLLEFSFFVQNQVGEVDEGLAKCLGQMESLQKVTLPICFGAPRVVTALTSLKELTTIRRHLNTPHGRDRVAPQLGTQWDTKLEAFKALEVLDFQTTFSRAESALTCLTPLFLHTLEITTVGTVSNQKLLSLFSAVAISCPGLQDFWLNLFSGSIYSTERFQFETFEPLFRCPLLRTLEIGHPRSILLTEENVVAIGSAWPDLDILYFVDGGSLDKEQTPLSILKAFALCLPGVENLGLTCRIDLEGLQMSAAPAALDSLGILDLGLSAISQRDVIAVTTFLGFICPPGLEVQIGVTDWLTQADATFQESARHAERWGTVRDRVRTFH